MVFEMKLKVSLKDKIKGWIKCIKKRILKKNERRVVVGLIGTEFPGKYVSYYIGLLRGFQVEFVAREVPCKMLALRKDPVSLIYEAIKSYPLEAWIENYMTIDVEGETTEERLEKAIKIAKERGIMDHLEIDVYRSLPEYEEEDI